MSSSSSSSSVDAAAQLRDLRRTSPNILFIIARSKNLNIVVYEANLLNGDLDPNNPVIVYWLDLDPAYVAENRAKGIISDRSELGRIEKSLAYGLTATPIPNKAGYFSIQLVAFPERPVIVWLDQSTKQLKAQMKINNIQCDLSRIFVSAVDSWIGLPKVQYVDVTGTDPSTQQQQTERITPK